MIPNKKNINAFFYFSLLTFFTHAYSADAFNPDSNDSISFSPKKGTTANLLVNQNVVTLKLQSERGIIEEKMTLETEKKITIQLADYNFDGYRDFSLSHTDDGMGTYQIYQIYVFSPPENKFIRLQPREALINSVFSGEKRVLVDSDEMATKVREN